MTIGYTAAAVVVGFAVGAVVGFTWSQGTKGALAHHTKTDWRDGKVTVEIDYAGAAGDGLRDGLRDWWGGY